jgi:MOSC domain-containing protein YiiM
MSTQVGKVLEMFISTSNGRLNKKKLSLDLKGVLEDKYYNKDVQRSVLLATVESYELALSHGIKAPYSALGENILMDYNPYHLEEGRQLQIGNLILEISQHCTLCQSFAKIDEKLPEILKNDRGIFARVVQEGVVSQGDNIYLLSEEKKKENK